MVRGLVMIAVASVITSPLCVCGLLREGVRLLPRLAAGTKKAQSYHPHVAWGHGRLRLQERAVPWLYTSQRPSIIDSLRQASRP